MGKKIIQRQSLTEQIKSILIERIVNGALCPGDRLKELQIAEEFGTSQAPVREAIRSLQALGYVQHIPHVGALVKTFSSKEMEEAHQVREALEGHCLLLANIAIEELAAELDRQVEAMRMAMLENDIKAFSMADNLFHRTIVKFSGNNNMLVIWDSLRIHLQVMLTLVETSMPLDELYALHPPIVASLKRGHRENAARFLAEHYRKITASLNKSEEYTGLFD
ncbi:GntR family transcriptional regulator [Desulforhopalus sp. IMCC35007]|uniref:GntR family transcriptional regulator n=1 Tax=Desulforhopalus sp. IMCC35007 TaxID=2569543 RepID=UPI00145E8CF1|nr:GntR family transcriptional regulator [Desulforhopalus sp. IMCC35007]